MQARLFSYLDTQLTRLGGPNFDQIPINRPARAGGRQLRRDGFRSRRSTPAARRTCRTGSAAAARSWPPPRTAGTMHVPEQVDGPKVRERGPDDHYTQATLFWNSMTPVEQDHIVDAYTFELVEGGGARRGQADASVGSSTCTPISPPGSPTGSGSTWRISRPPPSPTRSGTPTPPTRPAAWPESPALSMVTEDEWPPDGRVVQILADDGADLTGLKLVRDALVAAGAAVHVVATHKGNIAGKRRGDAVLVDRSFHTASAAECRRHRGGRRQRAGRRPGRHRPPAEWPSATTSRSRPGATAPTSSRPPASTPRSPAW